MNKSINLRDYEVRAVKDNKLSLVVRPIKLKPNDYFNTMRICCGELEERGSFGFCSELYDYHCPYPPGAVLVGKEAFKISKQFPPPGNGAERIKVEFKHGGSRWINMRDTGYKGRYLTPDRWRPSVQMPNWASRFTFEVESVEVRRVQTASILHVTNNLWDTHYGKTEYKWANNPWCWFISVKDVGK